MQPTQNEEGHQQPGICEPSCKAVVEWTPLRSKAKILCDWLLPDAAVLDCPLSIKRLVMLLFPICCATNQ